MSDRVYATMHSVHRYRQHIAITGDANWREVTHVYRQCEDADPHHALLQINGTPSPVLDGHERYVYRHHAESDCYFIADRMDGVDLIVTVRESYARERSRRLSQVNREPKVCGWTEEKQDRPIPEKVKKEVEGLSQEEFFRAVREYGEKASKSV